MEFIRTKPISKTKSHGTSKQKGCCDALPARDKDGEERFFLKSGSLGIPVQILPTIALSQLYQRLLKYLKNLYITSLSIILISKKSFSNSNLALEKDIQPPKL